MTQYLIQEFTDSTGYTFTHVVKASDNEKYTVVNADSEREALAIAKQPRGLLSYIPSEFNNNPISKALKASIYRKDSE